MGLQMLTGSRNHRITEMLSRILCLVLSVTLVSCEAEDGEPRVGYYSINSAGVSTLTFNATSVQNGVILGLLILVLGALILPLFGINLLESDEFASASTEDAYGSAYYNFAKRTGLDQMGHVLSAL